VRNDQTPVPSRNLPDFSRSPPWARGDRIEYRIHTYHGQHNHTCAHDSERDSMAIDHRALALAASALIFWIRLPELS
jgi:hypothetical protein